MTKIQVGCGTLLINDWEGTFGASAVCRNIQIASRDQLDKKVFTLTRRHLRSPLSLMVFAVLATPATQASDDIRSERVQFERGKSSAVIEGSITGYESVDYVLGAGKGQYMNINMATDNSANYFNILAPGENETAMFIGSTSGTQYEGILPASGDYKVRVYMMRNAARREETANYRLEMIINARETAPASGQSAAAQDALVAGTNYHATGNIPCSMGGGQPTGSCAFGVTREGNGSSIVKVTKPDGRKRSIFFENGKATGADVSEADPGEFRASRESDLTIVRIGQERYEIPDAVIYGG
jgi:hypothetical protein